VIQPPLVDERLGLPSASGMPRLLGTKEEPGCLGSFLFEKRLKDPSKKTAANRGTKIHAVMHGMVPFDSLSHSDKICAERLAFEEARLVEEFGMEGATQIKEERLWLEEDGTKIFSGQPDVIHLNPSKALIVNFKTGFYEPEPIQENAQMLAEAVLTSNEYMMPQELTVALIHPNVTVAGKISQTHTYQSEYLIYEAWPKLSSVAQAAMKPDAPRNPSRSACNFCLGKKTKTCPEWLEWSNS